MTELNFPDKHSGCSFQTGCDEFFKHCLEHGIAKYPLIKWCEQYLNSQSTFVDIGAHMGTYSVILSKKCAKVHAFEAQYNTYNNLLAGVSLNKRANIEAYNIAVGNEKKSAVLYQRSTSGIDSTVDELVASHTETLRTETVKMDALDSFNITGVDLLKISVEGHELEVITGALQTLVNNNFPPFIFESWKDTSWYQDKKEKLFDCIRKIGYKIITIGGCDNTYLAADHPLRVPHSAKLAAHISKIVVGLPLGDVAWEIYGDLATYFREHCQYHHAYHIAAEGLCKEHNPEWSHILQKEVALSAQYLDDKDAHQHAYRCCERVILGRYADGDLKNTMLDLQVHYMTALKSSSIVPINITIDPQYTGSSSALVKNDKGFLLNLRGVNYHINKHGGYIIRDPEGIVRTKNYLIDLDENLRIKGEHRELLDHSGVSTYPVRVRGMEDVRLFGDHQFFCTRLDVNPRSVPQICYGEYDPITGAVSKILALRTTPDIQCEKNWMPLVKDGTVHFVHTVFPLRLYKLDTTTGVTTLVNTAVNIDPKLDLGSFRGSGGLIPYKDGWLGSVHQVYHDNPRKYFHRLVWFNQEFTIMKYSRIFFFDSPNIEFSLSMCLNSTDLLIPYSFRDNSSRIAVLPLEELDAMLQ